MTGATHVYNLRSKDNEVEHCDQMFGAFEASSVAPSTPRPSPSTRHTLADRKDIEVDPSENPVTTELRAPHTENTIPPSTPDIIEPKEGMVSWGLEGGFSASSDAGGETCRSAMQSGGDTCEDDLDDLDVARSKVQEQRDLNARRIHYEQKAKQLWVESWVLKQRSKDLAREAEALEQWIARQVKEGGKFDDDPEPSVPEPVPEPEPEPEPEATTMEIDDDHDEAERASVRSGTHPPTEVFSESDQRAWVLLAQYQGVGLHI